ncbi:MAG: DUF2207 domain-containing protein [Clostridiales bacterium]|nr:DUF2207 domain-containing protein [Clostridiales bacterium]
MVKYIIYGFREVMMTLKNKECKSNNRKLPARVTVLGLMAVLVICVISYISVSGVLADPEDTPGGTSSETTTTTTNETGAVEVTSYEMTAVVAKDHSYTVEEKISVNIPSPIQSIEFAIPSGNFRISDIEVENVAYETKKASEASIVSITDAEKLSEGSHVYTIKYVIREYEDLDESKDMFYFNVLLPEWKQPIGKVSINVSFPDDFPWDDMQCYAGQFGVQDVNNKIDFRASKASHSVTITGVMIPENFGITLKAQLPDGYWEDELDGSWSITAITFLMAGVSLLLLLLWIIGGRDPKVKKQKVTKPIEGLSPVELGYIFNSKVRIRDVLLLILQFAQKGYLSISEYEPKRYRLIKGKRPVGEERMYRNAYKILFEDVYKGRALAMEKVRPRIERIRDAIENDVAAGFTTNDSAAFTPVSRAFRYAGAVILGIGLAAADAISYFYAYRSPNYIEGILAGIVAAIAVLLLCKVIDRRDSSSNSAGAFGEIMASLVLALPVAYASYRVASNTGKPLVILPMMLASGLAAFLIVIMRARGKENAVLVSKIRRLRNFIYHPTPKELLENHLADSEYYYDMMLYALAFGAEESWAISFLTLEVPEPEWYSDDIEGHAFSNLRGTPTTIDHARDFRSFMRTFENI